MNIPILRVLRIGGIGSGSARSITPVGNCNTHLAIITRSLVSTASQQPHGPVGQHEGDRGELGTGEDWDELIKVRRGDDWQQ